MAKCFVIMPFSKTSEEHTEEYWTEHFETFLKPHIEECQELKAIRSEPLRGDILKQIITNLATLPVVVADLTDLKPNVFWELGVRQSFKHGTVTIAEKGTKLPFDVSVKGTLSYYPKDHIKNVRFIKRFKKAIKDCLSHPDNPDSQVLETISGRGTLFDIIHRNEAIRRVDALISERESNSRLLAYIHDVIKGKKIPTAFFRSASVELLITTRYLHGDSSFYGVAEAYFDVLLAMNEQLVVWEQFRDSTTAWFLGTKMKSDTSKRFKKYKKILDTARALLITSC